MPAKLIHGDSKPTSPYWLVYRLWMSMKQRCMDPKADNYYLYGGRGISVSKVWIYNYPRFKRWALSHGYQKGLQLDRVNNNGNYTPQNCRFVTCAENAQNTRRNVINKDKIRRIRELRLNGLSHRAIGKELGVTHSTIGYILRGKTWKGI